MYKNNKNWVLRPYTFTIIYDELRERLQIDIESYIVLSAMMFYSKQNTFYGSITHIKEMIGLARNTVLSRIRDLISKGFISKCEISGEYYINADMIWEFENCRKDTYITIYHEFRKKHKLKISEYTLLALYYSLSRKLGFTYANVPEYIKILDFEFRNYFNLRKELCEKNLITNKANKVTLTPDTFKYFDSKVERERIKGVQILHSVQDCSDFAL